jgi:two-component system phosphate regulon response regulator PhoB
MAQDPTSPLALVVEDDAALAALLRYNLEEEGFRVQEALDGPEALALSAAQPPRIVLLDWMLPTLSGLEVCRRMRADARFHGVPIIVVTARNDDRDMIRALEAGADDYVTKPFRFAVLLARMQAALRRAQPALATVRLAHGELTLDLATRRATRRGQPVVLGPTEFRLLHFLMDQPGRVFTREEVLDALWGRRAKVELRTLDVHVGRLRRALGDDGTPGLIRTVRGAGYTLEPAAG